MDLEKVWLTTKLIKVALLLDDQTQNPIPKSYPSVSRRIGPTQGQRKTLPRPRVGFVHIAFGTDDRCSPDWTTRPNRSRLWVLKISGTKKKKNVDDGVTDRSFWKFTGGTFELKKKKKTDDFWQNWNTSVIIGIVFFLLGFSSGPMQSRGARTAFRSEMKANFTRRKIFRVLGFMFGRKTSTK